MIRGVVGLKIQPKISFVGESGLIQGVMGLKIEPNTSFLGDNVIWEEMTFVLGRYDKFFYVAFNICICRSLLSEH